MAPIEFLAQKGLDVAPDIYSGQYRQLRLTGPEIAALIQEYVEMQQPDAPSDECNCCYMTTGEHFLNCPQFKTYHEIEL